MTVLSRPDHRGRIGPTARTFPASAGAVRDARAFVEEVLNERIGVAEALLIVSELATNAVQHARTPFEVRVWDGERVRIEVADQSASPPVVASYLPLASEHGRGLILVGAVAAAWGTVVTAAGKVVWCELIEPTSAPT